MNIAEPPGFRLPRLRRPLQPVDLSGRVCVVTGASAGIGVETAARFAEWGAEVVLVGRNPDRTREARDAVRAHSGNEAVSAEICDFASLAAVRELGVRLRERPGPLHVLVNNAGLWLSERRESADGYEMTFAVNHLAPFLLTDILLPKLIESAPARIINVSSRLHEKERGFRFHDPQALRHYGGLRAYRQSKLANVLFTRELARRLVGTGVVVHAVHPGDVATSVVRDSRFLTVGLELLGRRFLLTPEEGARTTVHAATDASAGDRTGRYFADCRERPASPAALSWQAAEQLWRLSEQLVAKGAS